MNPRRQRPMGLSPSRSLSTAPARILRLSICRLRVITTNRPRRVNFWIKLAAGFVRLTALQDRFLHMQKLATTDELTGLSNSRWFREKLIQIMETSRKRKAPVTLLLFDIDDFKKYNDRYGHGVGDEILKQTAQLMRLAVREHDIVARIGGDEFAVIFWENQGPRTVRDPHAEPDAAPGRPPQTPAIMCKRFQSLLSKHTFSHLGPTGQGSLTISGGLATYPVGRGESRRAHRRSG